MRVVLPLKRRVGSDLPNAPATTPDAFVTRPAVLFADEPTGNLDTHTGERIVSLMFDLNAQSHTTLVLVTHDRAVASRCGRVLQMESGQLK